MKPTKNIFESLFGDIDKFLAESVRQEDLIETVKATTEALQSLESRLNNAVSDTRRISASDAEHLSKSLDEMEDRLEQLVSQRSTEHSTSLQSAVTSLQSELSRIESMIPEIPDHTERFMALEEGLKNTQKLDGEGIRNYLEALNDDDRLAMEAIRGLVERLQELEKRPSGGGSVARGLYFLIDGVKKGILNNMNFKAGSNMAIAHSKVNGQDTITFTASGGGPGGLTVETPTGTVDGSNTTFTVSDEPQWVVADGTTYFDGQGYTYAALTITMDVPPSASIRAII